MTPVPTWAVLLTTILTLGMAGTVLGQDTATSATITLPLPLLSAHLRHTLPLPKASLSRKMALSLGVIYSPTRGFYLLTGAEAADAPLRAKALQRSLQGIPQDAPRYELLARYERYMGQQAQATQAFTQAAALYQRQAQQRSLHFPVLAENVLAGRSRALAEIGQSRKAKAEMRQALIHRPHAWKLWDALGQTQSEQAGTLVSHARHGDRTAITQALRLNAEARSCFNHAVKVGPRQGHAYAARGEFLGFDQPSLVDDVRRLRGTNVPSFETRIPSSALADFRQAARLLPNDPYAVAYPVWQEVSELGFFQLHLPFPSQAAWHAMPASTRRAAQAALLRLRLISQGQDEQLARRADVALGFLLYETQRSVVPAERTLRQGLPGPDHQEAAEMLMHIMGLEDQMQALALFCQAEARKRNTPRLYLIAAWAEVQQAHWPQARAQVERALTLEPGDPVDLIMLAVITLKAGVGAASVQEAGVLLGKAEEGVAHTQPPNLIAVECEEYQVTHAFYLALSGHLDAAKAELQAVLDQNPQNESAVKGLAVLKQGSA